MKALFRFSVLVALLGMQVSCLPVSEQNEEAGSISSCANNGVEQRIYGKWKKLTGYGGDQIDDEDLIDDFDVMIIPQGGHMCEVKIVDSAQSPNARYHATFEHHQRNKTLDFYLSKVGSGTGLSKGASYSVNYTLGCDGKVPTLRFDYANGDVETYRIWARRVGINDCGVDPDDSK